MTFQLIRAQVFISHNHSDKEVAKEIAQKLLVTGHEVWLDKWEILPGDSLIEKISDGILDSSYLLVLLSKKSAASNWVKRELEVAISKQLRDKSIKVIPCLLEDCEVPLFLQPIMYADFRKHFDEGMSELLPSIKAADLATSRRVESTNDEWLHDYAFEWNFNERNPAFYFISVTIVSHLAKLEGSTIFTIDIKAASDLQKRFSSYPEEFHGVVIALMFIYLFTEGVSLERQKASKRLGLPNKDLGIEINGEKLTKWGFQMGDEKGRHTFEITTTIRYLGKPLDRNLVFYYGELVCRGLQLTSDEIKRKVPAQLEKHYIQWVEKNPW